MATEAPKNNCQPLGPRAPFVRLRGVYPKEAKRSHRSVSEMSEGAIWNPGLVLSFFVVPWQTRQAGACPAWARKGDRVADSWWTVITDMVGELSVRAAL